MKRIFWVYFALLILGLVVLAWPEEDDVMMVQLSDTHGPSKMDLAGILIIMMGYLPMVKEVWKHSVMIKGKLGNGNWKLLVGSTSLAVAAIAWSLYVGNDAVLWISVAIATVAQAILVRIAYQTA